jgi:hypothetical protein
LFSVKIKSRDIYYKTKVMIFHVSPKEERVIKQWKSTLPLIQHDMFGNRYAYEFLFRPTGLGIIKIVRRIDGLELDLTDYDSW